MIKELLLRGALSIFHEISPFLSGTLDFTDERYDHLRGAENADDNRQNPERRIVRVADSQIGQEESAEVKERVNGHTEPQVIRFPKHDGEHRTNEKGVADLLQDGEYSRAA